MEKPENFGGNRRVLFFYVTLCLRSHRIIWMDSGIFSFGTWENKFSRVT